MECATGVLTAPTGAAWIWGTLADSASSHHIPSLAPAVALPAPRHDRRRTGAAGSPPGGFPFVEFRYAVVKCAAGAASRIASEFLSAVHKTPFIPATAGIHDFVSRASEARPGTSRPDLRPWVPATPASRGAPRGDERRRESRGTPSKFTHVHAGLAGQRELALLQDAALAGPPRRAFRAHSSVGRAADS
jgi:hypothetical protein